MLFWCIFAEILERRETSLQFLHFIEDNQRFSRYDGLSRYCADTEQNSIYGIILCEQILYTLVVVAVDICYIFIERLAKVL